MLNGKKDPRSQPKDRLLNAVIVTDILLVLLLLGMWTLHNQIEDFRAEGRQQAEQAQKDTLANRETGYKNRAKTCSLILTLGNPLDSFCLEPEVVRYYDPNVKPTVGDKSSNRSLICKLAAQMKIEPIPDECLLVQPPTTTTTTTPRPVG